MQQPVFETARLILRPFRLADAQAVQQLAGAPEVADTTLNIPHPYPDGAAEAWISGHQQQFAEGSAATFALVEREQQQLVGAVGLRFAGAHAHAELGYWVGVPFWNRGYASEAAEQLLDYAFTQLDLQRVFARHLARNPASGRVMQKIGMQYEGCLRQHVRKRERFEDLVLYGILRSEWQARRA